MINDDTSAPATKQDIQLLLEKLTGVQNDQVTVMGAVQQNSQDIQNLKELMLDQDDMLQKQIGGLAIKEELYAVKEELQEQIKEEIHASERHVLAAVEQKRYDDVGITKDRFTEHDRRITRLEKVAGVA